MNGLYLMADIIDMIFKILLIVGGLNWGLMIFVIHLVSIFSFGVNAIANVIYAW